GAEPGKGPGRGGVDEALALRCLQGHSPVTSGFHGEFRDAIEAIRTDAAARALVMGDDDGSSDGSVASNSGGEDGAAAVVAALRELKGPGGDAARAIFRDVEFRLADGYDPV